ncbi:TPA: hypothetical protein ACKP1B_002962 [Serratia fonticola]
MRKNKILAVATPLFLASLTCSAGEVKLNETPAAYQQNCGKTISLYLIDLTQSDPGHSLLGVKNNETGAIDLFLSKSPISTSRSYDQYTKVFFDHLSKRYVNSPDNLSFVWGAARENGQAEVSYSLALGKHVYSCGKLKKLEKLPEDRLNHLYGDQDV